MKVVAFLQNMWFKHPERMQHQLETTFKGDRERFIATWLFFGCLTGRRLRKAFGEDLCDQIVWEEISREIGGHSSSHFPADMEHIGQVLDLHKPTLVLAFGKLAAAALRDMQEIRYGHWPLVLSPHPAARGAHVPGKLAEVAEVVRFRLAEQPAADVIGDSD